MLIFKVNFTVHGYFKLDDFTPKVFDLTITLKEIFQTDQNYQLKNYQKLRRC